MKIDNIALHKFIKSKGITHFYHANSVSSAITYINENGLLSRGDVCDRNLFQTEQRSDSKDKLFDVWFDVFIDTIDLHEHFGRQNKYGPVVFKFNIDFLLNSELDIWITKNNPMHWSHSMSTEDKYFQDVNELDRLWNEIDHQKKMFTIKKPNCPVLFESLESIIIDDPKVSIYDGVTLYSELTKTLLKATEKNMALANKITVRECGARCYCKENYLKETSTTELAKLFLPKEHEYFP